MQTDSIETVPEPVSDAPADKVEQHDLAGRAMSAMQQLPADQRRVLELAISQGLSYSQIAERFSVPLGTVKSHARRGLIRLREMLSVEQESESR